MGESFEARLIASSSQETFKKAKHILKAGELLCCHESLPGTIRAICRDSRGMIYRTELKGFPNGPLHGTCSCGAGGSALCVHAMAAALYHAKYTIKAKEVQEVKDGPAQYAGLKFAGLPELLTQVVNPSSAYVEINAESEFPHVPSKWERVPLTVTLKMGKREYFGNLNNLRQLHFNKNLAVALPLTAFPLQDRQIIRYLAINAQQDGTKLTLDAEQCAEFFQCLIGFKNFRRMGEKVVVHRELATPLLLLEKVPRGGYVLRSAIIVNGAPLPLNDVKVITGRAGCWVGMLGEYWWIPAQTDVAWLRSFLRTTVQPCDGKAAELLLKNPDLPIQVMPTDGLSVKELHFKTLYDGHMNADGSLSLELQFEYNGRLCRADQSRLGSNQGGDFWRRNTRGEFQAFQELINFGFHMLENNSTGSENDFSLILRDPEAIGMFVDEVVPGWLREKRDCLLSSSLAALCGDAGRMQISVSVMDKNDQYFDLAVQLTGGGVSVRWKDLVAASVNNEYYFNGGANEVFIKIPAKLRLLAGSLAQVVTELPPDAEHRDCDLLRIPRLAALYWAEAGSDIPGAVPLDFLRMKVDQDVLLEDLKHPQDAVNHELLRADLRPYQQAGVFYLKQMALRGRNMILADEMGLGKTVQTLALITSSPRDFLPALVVCPTSLVDNWVREAGKFAPSLKVLEISGPSRKSLWEKSSSQDLCICSYALIKRDIAYLENLSFRYLILDEAQHIKNPASANAQTCKRISADHKLVLTGTPLENSAEDLWSIFDFLHAGLLGTLSSFRTKYMELLKNADLKKELSRRIAPFILRRKKADVCSELPPKQEQVVYCEMNDVQKKLYRFFAEKARQCCEDVRLGKDAAGGHMAILSSLLRLRQVCCDPALLPENLLKEAGGSALESVADREASAKMELLQELLQESIDSGHKVLVFSQFTSMLKLMCQWLEKQGITYAYLDGSTKDRMERVDAFNNSADIPVFLLSLKAGGLGLNLTSADTVIIYDPWWNPAAEAQAADRTHRIGQTRSVNCIKLVVKDSVEEKVLELQDRKKELFGSLVEDSGSALSGMTLEDFEFLLKE